MADDEIRVATAAEGYDRQDPEGIPIFGFAGVIVVTLIASFVFVTYYYGVVTDGQIQAAVGGNLSARDLKEVRDAETPVLTGYRMVDKAAGKVSLPVDRAMDLLEQEAKAGTLFYPAKPTPVKTAADLAAPGGAPGAPGAPAAGAPAAPAATPAPTAGAHEKK
jgi:hypothetical protein